MVLLERIKRFLKPEVTEALSVISSKSSNSDNQFIFDSLISHLSKLTAIIDVFTEKEIAVDKLLNEWSRENLQQLINIMNKLNKHIINEWGELLEYEKSVDSLEKATISGLERLRSQLKNIYESHKEQLDIISNKNKLLEDKLSLIKFVKAVIYEGYELQEIFKIEVKYLEDFESVDFLNMPKINKLFQIPEERKKQLYYFMQDCIFLIMNNNVKVVIVTEDSAHILGVMLLDALKRKGIKVPIFGFNPRAIDSPSQWGSKIDAKDSELIEAFKKERRAVTKTIIGNNVLIIEEFCASGMGLFLTKKFFEKLGAKLVYTAVFAGFVSRTQGTPDIPPRFNDYPEWTHLTGVSGRVKFLKAEKVKTLRTRTAIARSKYKVMNDLYVKLVSEFNEFMKKIAKGEF